MSNHIRNTNGITEYAKKRTDEALNRVKITLEELYKMGEEITKYKVFKKSGVSRNFVYNNEIVEEMVNEYQCKKPIVNFSEIGFEAEIQKLKQELNEAQIKIKESTKFQIENENLRKKIEKLQSEYNELEKHFQMVCNSKGFI